MALSMIGRPAKALLAYHPRSSARDTTFRPDRRLPALAFETGGRVWQWVLPHQGRRINSIWCGNVRLMFTRWETWVVAGVIKICAKGSRRPG